MNKGVFADLPYFLCTYLKHKILWKMNKVDPKKTAMLREYAGKLNNEMADKILSGEENKKPKNSTPPPIKIGDKERRY